MSTDGGSGVSRAQHWRAPHVMTVNQSALHQLESQAIICTCAHGLFIILPLQTVVAKSVLATHFRAALSGHGYRKRVR